MDNLELEGKWNEVKGKLKKNHAELQNSELQYSKGREEELVGTLQRKLGKSRDEVLNILNDYSKSGAM